jgi:methylenetetrahydrofolate reductase (NADPH)
LTADTVEIPNTTPTISFEFFPPKDVQSEANLWKTIDELQQFKPDFVSITYGAGGGTRDRTVRIASEFIEKTGVQVIGHLTCVGSTRAELVEILGEYKDAGFHGLLALRGDPVGGPTAPWVTTPGGFDYADQLVELASEIGGFSIGVAAFPDVHPASDGNFMQDINVLLRKEELGATFAITQFVFDSGRYEALRNALDARGSKLSIYPGIMPVTSYPQIVRMLELSGGYMPKATRLRFARYQNDQASLKKLGIDVAVQVCEDVFALGAEGLHFYALNNAGPTSEIIKQLSMLNR